MAAQQYEGARVDIGLRGTASEAPSSHLHCSTMNAPVKGSCANDTSPNVVPVKSRRCREPCSTVEHLVLLNMPYLQGDQEASILHALYNLQFKFDDVLVLAVGRLLEKNDKVTHALCMRFPNLQVLKEYYCSKALKDVGAIMRPFIQGKFVNDYISTSRHLDCLQNDPKYVTLTFLRNRRDICSEEVDCALQSLVSVVDDLTYVDDFTAGSNVFVQGEQVYTHGFIAYARTIHDLAKLTENHHFSKVLKHKVLPLSSNTLTVCVMAFKPITSCL